MIVAVAHKAHFQRTLRCAEDSDSEGHILAAGPQPEGENGENQGLAVGRNSREPQAPLTGPCSGERLLTGPWGQFLLFLVIPLGTSATPAGQLFLLYF